MSLLLGLGTSLLGGGINALGNMFGTKMFGGGSNALMEQQSQIGLDMAKQAAPGFLVNTNAMGQKGPAATVGAGVAMRSFSPQARTVQALNTQNQTANQLATDARNMGEIGISETRRSNAATRDKLAQAMLIQGLPASVAQRAAAELEQQSAGNTIGAAQAAESTNLQALSTGANIRGQAQGMYDQAVGQQYQRDVVPYLNQWENMSNLGQTMANIMGPSAVANQQADVMANNPFMGLGTATNMTASSLLNKYFQG